MSDDDNQRGISAQSITNILLTVIAAELYDHFHPGQLDVVWFWGIVAIALWWGYKAIKFFVVWNLPKVRKEREAKAARSKAYFDYRIKRRALEDKYRNLSGGNPFERSKERDQAFKDLEAEFGPDILKRDWE